VRGFISKISIDFNFVHQQTLVNDSPAVFLFSETPKGAVETAPGWYEP